MTQSYPTDEQVEKAAIAIADNRGFSLSHDDFKLPYSQNSSMDSAVKDARAALSAVNPFEWRGMDSAPKDGSRFLAMGGGLDRIEITEWCDRVCAWSTESWTLEDHDHEFRGYNRPLYWRPLDLPPSPEGNK